MRFLFLFSDTGGGHRASANAVCAEMQRLYGDAAEVALADIFVEMGRWPFPRFPQWYPKMVKLNALPWRISYQLTDQIPLIKPLSYLAWPYTRRPLKRFLHDCRPDVVVSFHGIPNYALDLALRRMHSSVPKAIVVLDLVTVHTAWFAPGFDAYIVPTEVAKARALRAGLPAERVHVVGMPARRAFVEASDLPKAVAREQLGLPQERPIVLLVGGGEGMGPLAPVVAALVTQRPEALLVAVAGRNHVLQQRLAQLAPPEQLRVEGFVSNMEVWMRAVDLLVTKAGPNTLVEAFIAGLPTVLYTALPGQEAGNVTYVVEQEAGIWAPRPTAAAAAVQALLGDPARLQRMAGQARSLARPHAATHIAQHLWALGEARPEASAPYLPQFGGQRTHPPLA